MYDFSVSEYGYVYAQIGQLFVATHGDGSREVKFLIFNGFSPLPLERASEAMEKEEKKWDQWQSETNKAAPEGVNRCYHSSIAWCWVATSFYFVQSALQGIGIALPLAFVVLIISTQNWIMALCALVDIIGIVMAEMGTISALGWKFGVSESVAVVMIIGFSVELSDCRQLRWPWFSRQWSNVQCKFQVSSFKFQVSLFKFQVMHRSH